MTDRVHSLQVVLSEDMRVDDVEALCRAIERFKGVTAVGHMGADSITYMAAQRAKHELIRKIYEVLL